MVRVGHVVEAKKMPWTPPNPRPHGVVSHGLCPTPACFGGRDRAKELIASFLVWEMGGGPRTPLNRRATHGGLPDVRHLVIKLPRRPAHHVDERLPASKDLFLAQRFARHASPLTTVVYTHPSDEDMATRLRALGC